MNLERAPSVSAAKKRGIEHRTIASAVAGALRQRILSGELPAGAQLRQDGLAEEFDVSRIPIREALFQLESEGLVRIQPHRGAVVSELSFDDIRELFDLRALLEPRVLRSSAPHLTADDYEKLSLLETEYAARRRAGDMGGCASINTTFHMGLYRHAALSRTRSFVGKLLQDSERLTRLQLFSDFTQDRSTSEHRAILDACRSGAYAEAARILKGHVECAGRTLERSLRAIGV